MFYCISQIQRRLILYYLRLQRKTNPKSLSELPALIEALEKAAVCRNVPAELTTVGKDVTKAQLIDMLIRLVSAAQPAYQASTSSHTRSRPTPIQWEIFEKTVTETHNFLKRIGVH